MQPDSEKALFFYVKDVLDHRLNSLREHFPAGTLHAVAIKTCSHPDILRYVVKSGYGLEAASLEEVLLAKDAGAANHKIVFDSPVKTRDEINYCHENLEEMLVNANSLQELERYPQDFSCKVGLRINPLVDNDAEEIFNVSTKSSKFGVHISRKSEIIQACLAHAQVSCLHMHIGSSIHDFSPNLLAIQKVLDLANEINATRSRNGMHTKIDTLDIGGGVHFNSNNNAFTLQKFTDQLKLIPGISDYSLVTEFGTYVYEYAGFVVSDIEYIVKDDEILPANVFIHVGADLFLRKVYAGLSLNYTYAAIHTSEVKDREIQTYNVVGPLCFAGDVLFEDIHLPELREGDKFIILNAGANTLSMWSRHCSRKEPDMIFVNIKAQVVK
jgi:diaminopimelate decarboxylase